MTRFSASRFFHYIKKDKSLSEYKEDELFNEYTNLLKETLVDKNVIVLSAVGTQKSLTEESIDTDWLKWQADIIGLDLKNLQKEILLKKEEKLELKRELVWLKT